MRLIDSRKLAFIPGPMRFDEPFFSTELHDMVDYPAQDILGTLDLLLPRAQQKSREGGGSGTTRSGA